MTAPATNVPTLRLRSRERMESFNIRLPPSTVRTIASAANQRNTYPSELARFALESGLEQLINDG